MMFEGGHWAGQCPPNEGATMALALAGCGGLAQHGKAWPSAPRPTPGLVGNETGVVQFIWGSVGSFKAPQAALSVARAAQSRAAKRS